MIVLWASGMRVRATATRLETLVGMLQQQLGRKALDKTGLDGGLRLASTKGPVPVLVIESVEKPTEN